MKTRLLQSAAIVAALLASAPIANAQFASSIDLELLGTSEGKKFLGVIAETSTGRDVAAAGDVNGDGLKDFIIGSHDLGTAGTGSGVSYVVFGKSLNFPGAQFLDLNGNNGFRIEGVAAGDHSGWSVSGAGDVNGDGYDDLIVGAYGAEPNGPYSGSSYVVFGKGTAFASALFLSSLNGSNGFRIDGRNAGDYSGHVVSRAGDVNGDGFGDVVVGAPFTNANGAGSGSVYVVFGKAKTFAPVLKLSNLNGNNGFRINGRSAGDKFGFSAAAAGDFNNDGFDDVIIGAPSELPGTLSATGFAYVMFGKASGFNASMNASSLTGSKGFRMKGVDDQGQLGNEVAAAGDVNGDGFDDVIVSAHLATAFGEAYVVFGKSGTIASPFQLSAVNGSNAFRLDGATANKRFGISVSGAGDVNGDGFAEIGGTDYDGIEYVMFGKSGGFASAIGVASFNGFSGFRLENSAGDPAGIGDFDGDGIDDMLVGSPGLDNGPDNVGGAFVVFGRTPLVNEVRLGGTGSNRINGGLANDGLSGLDGNDVLEGREDGDLLNGGTGKDTASYANSGDVVTASLENPLINSGDALGDTYASIERLEGSRFNDTLTGNSGANRLTGRSGKDTLRGKGGKDVFAYTSANDSIPGTVNRDEIIGFNPGKSSTAVDKIDVAAIDAKSGKNGNQKFTFIGTKGFSGKKGELRLKKIGGVLLCRATPTEQAPDFEIV